MKKLIRRYIKYPLYRLKWHTAKFINYSAPPHLDIELSTKCNLNCEFCFRKEVKFKKMNMPEEMMLDIYCQAKELGVKSFKLNWRGEGILNSNWGSMWDGETFLYLNTSLSMDLTNREIKEIAKYIDVLSVSIDSINAEGYDKIRRGGWFLKTWNNFLLLDYCREWFKKSKIIINRRTSKLTIDTDNEFKEKFNGRHVKFNIKPAMPRNKKNIYQVENKERKYCGQPSRRMVIDVEGNVWACCVAYKRQPELYLGNINNDSLKNIWNSDKRKKLVSDLKHGIYNNACLNCTSKDSYK